MGPVYDEALGMAWFVLELIVKSMDLELAQVPQGGDIARLRLEEEVYQCIWQLSDCLLTEVQERAGKGAVLAKRLNSSIAFFCFDLLAVVDPPQVFELVGVYLTKFAGMCPPALHRYKLTFLRIMCDHDFYIETPGRVAVEKNYLTTVLLKELFVSLDHEDAPLRTLAARTLAFLMCKHEYDVRYQQPELKLYVAQLYFPILHMILEEAGVFFALSPLEKRDVLASVLSCLRWLDPPTLHKSWRQSAPRTLLSFHLLQEALALFQLQPPVPKGAVPCSEGWEEAIGEPCFSHKLSPGANYSLGESSKQDAKVRKEEEEEEEEEEGAEGEKGEDEGEEEGKGEEEGDDQ